MDGEVEDKYKCQECGKAFKLKCTLTSHSAERHGHKPACQECNITFKCKSELAQHSIVHTGERNPECTTSGKEFQGNGNVREPMIRRTPVRSFHHCGVCGEIFRFKYLLNVHARVHSGGKFKCHLCGEAWQRQAELTKHTTKHTNPNPTKCLKCDQTFGSQTHLPKHTRIVHTVSPPKYECELCDKKYLWKRGLQRHMRGHNEARSKGGEGVVREEHDLVHTQVNDFKCHECGKRFDKKCAMMIHTRTHVGITSPKCPTCGKYFVNESRLLKHQVMHTGVRKYECTKCGKKFRQLDCLRVHEKKKFPCNAAQHKQVQGVPDNLFCWFCGDISPFKSDMMDHYKPQEMGFRYTCPTCDVHLEAAGNLRAYFNTFHNMLEQVGER